jgi:protein SCO1
MSSIAEVVNKVDMKPGEDYNIICISMDEFETPELALDKKKNYMKLIEKEFPESFMEIFNRGQRKHKNG